MQQTPLSCFHNLSRRQTTSVYFHSFSMVGTSKSGFFMHSILPTQTDVLLWEYAINDAESSQAFSYLANETREVINWFSGCERDASIVISWFSGWTKWLGRQKSVSRKDHLLTYYSAFGNTFQFGATLSTYWYSLRGASRNYGMLWVMSVPRQCSTVPTAGCPLRILWRPFESMVRIRQQ